MQCIDKFEAQQTPAKEKNSKVLIGSFISLCAAKKNIIISRVDNISDFMLVGAVSCKRYCQNVLGEFTQFEVYMTGRR